MFTATPIAKNETARGLEFTVEFSNGVQTFQQSVIPQDEQGLKHFITTELDRLNAIPELDTKFEVGVPFNFVEPAKVDPVLTNGDRYRIARFALIELKQDVELGLASQADYDAELAAVIALKSTK